MTVNIYRGRDIAPGEIYEDTFYHPCLCVKVEDGQIWGISLVDGSFPRSEEIGISEIRKLSISEAWIWRTQGPQGLSSSEEPEKKWW